MRRTAGFWLAVGVVGYCLLPWYMTEDGLLSFARLAQKAGGAEAGGLVHGLTGRGWLMPIVLLLIAITVVLMVPLNPVRQARITASFAAVGLAYVAVQGLYIQRSGARELHWLWDGLGAEQGQNGTGIGALIVCAALLFVLTTAISATGKGRGDTFIVGMIGLIAALVGVFVFFPVSHILIRAFELPGGGYDLLAFFPRFFSADLWSVSCLWSGGRCGPAINSVLLATLTGAGTTALGLAFALFFTRTEFRAKRLLRVLTIIPIITPPFVIGLALILLFGRTGTVTQFVADVLGLQPGRWLYGFWGIYMAQLLSFTPIAFLVLIGVVEGTSPSVEEASQTLNANRWQTFRRVSLPLMRPGLANAFLLGFIESMADFGNPLVLGGNFSVLSTGIYFAIVGTAVDAAKAAILSTALLSLTLGAFFVQRSWVGKTSYATVTGKGASGQHVPLNQALKTFCNATALPWAAFTLAVYSMIVFGSFVQLWGYNHSFTLDHCARAFSIDFSNGIHWTDVAWDSFFTTLTIAATAAPLTAIVGLATAYLLVRQNFVSKSAFEFSTILSFAIPGTVIGVSYIMAFNFPPIELTVTSIILIVVFVFRNMPVGRTGRDRRDVATRQEPR